MGPLGTADGRNLAWLCIDLMYQMYRVSGSIIHIYIYIYVYKYAICIQSDAGFLSSTAGFYKGSRLSRLLPKLSIGSTVKTS